MNIDENVWKQVQGLMDFNDEEMKIFRDNPLNCDIIAKGMTMMNKEIICEVIEAKGCMGGIKKGDKIYFNAGGQIKTKKCPDMVCMHIIEGGTNYIYTASELLYHGIDPDKMRFKRFGCLDVGLKCGGWGNVVCEVKVVDC